MANSSSRFFEGVYKVYVETTLAVLPVRLREEEVGKLDCLIETRGLSKSS